MPEEPTKAWWNTLPGVLSAIGAVITAVTGLIIALNSISGSKGGNDPHASQMLPNTERESTRTITPKELKQQVQFTPTKSSSQFPKFKASGSHSKPDLASSDGSHATKDAESQPPLVSQQHPTGSGQVNLFSSQNGGQIISGSGDGWAVAIDGNEKYTSPIMVGAEGTYGFKDEKSATFDKFTILVKEESEYNIKDFELYSSDDSPSGPFQLIGTFATQNMKLFKTPYQEFKFSPVHAKYVKMKILSSHGGHYIYSVFVYEFQLWGKLD